MTPMLYDVFSDDIENLEKNGLRIDFRPIKVHNARIKDVWVDYGPHEAFDTYLSLQERLVDYYYNIVYCIRLAVPKGPGATETPDRGGRTGMAADLEGDATSVTGSLRRGMGSMVRGVQYKVDVEFDADMAYAVFKDDEHIHYEEGEQTIVLRFSTPHYSPSPNLAQAYLKKENEVMPGLRPGYVVPDEDIDPPFEWRVSDIDYLLFQNECREIQSIIEQNRGKRS
ncbi:hypothetical protein EV182_004671 [Spiromyces aspiralis]|uniref:Uncharacterized protein n=1 Tax=Spiromyces aspiralis TaxID=68401 RepID=A0ACC1HBB3_9FUNG|nr:hypothetical protein EV182_004671 [Spiromyces aspiralis]